MAFCPNCGKPVTSQAIKCIACGKQLPAGKPQQGQRFKGTMLLTPAVPGAPQGELPDAPAAPAAPPAAPAAPPPAAAAPGLAAPAAGQVRSSKLKATMIGTGVPGIGAPAAKPAGAASASSPSVPSAGAPGVATVSDGAPPPEESLADTAPRADQVGDGAGDGPIPSAAETQAEASPRAAPKIFTGDLSGPAGAARGQQAPPTNMRALILVAVIGIILIAATGYGTALYLDLL